MRIAVTRAVSPRLTTCELTYIEREPIDASRAAAQHESYEQWLADHGCTIVRADDAPEHPDGVFVEDAAVVLDEVAVITRPGAESRRGETESIARVLETYRPLRRIIEPATIDGGDVLRIGRRVYVGLSQRTNEEAVAQLRQMLVPFGYTVIAATMRGCLHLKTGVTTIGDRTVVYNPDWIEPLIFGDVEAIAVDPDEPGAANVLRLDDTLLISASYPRTRALLESRGYRVESVDYDELEKAEAGVTCCSVIFRASHHP